MTRPMMFRGPPLTVRMHPKEFEFVNSLAGKLGLSNSDIVRMAIKEFKERYEKAPVMPLD